MKPTKRELNEAVKLAIEELVCQEIRLLQFGRVHAPSFIIDELSLSIKQSKREVVYLTQSLTQKERAFLIRKLIRNVVDEQIERTVEHRGNPCLRCGRLKFYDTELKAFEQLPVGTHCASALGCDCLEGTSRERCEEFVESLGSLSVVDCIDQMNLLYEVRDMFKKMSEIWEEYLMV